MSLSIYRCRSCDNMILSSSEEAEITCCGGSVDRIKDAEFEVAEPDSDDVFGQIFGITDTGVDICLCVMKEDEMTVDKIADEVGVDRSAVSRYANHLVDVGILEKREKNLKKGGYVNVYTHNPPEEVKENLTLGFYLWTSRAVELIDELNREKMEAMSEEGLEAEVDSGVFWTETD